MRYFIATTTVRDGEYEYLQYQLAQADNETEATKLVKDDLKDWTGGDYRKYEINAVKEVTRQEYKVLNKYIY